MNLSIDIDVSDALRYLDDVEKKQVPFALSRTLNKVAFSAARKELPEEAQRVFEGGATPYTKRGFKYTKSNKRNLVAYVYIDQATHSYLNYQVDGGIRQPARKKILIPTSTVKTNKFGNLSKAKRESFFKNPKYFTAKPSKTMGAGVFERYGKKKRKIRKVASFVNTATYTKKKLSVISVARKVVNRDVQRIFYVELKSAMRTRR